MKGFKKYLAIGLAMVLTLSTSVMAFAESTGSMSGTGNLEGTVDKDVYSVVLPTADDADLDFILDPEQLIKNTNAAKYEDKTFEEGATLFFASTVSDNDYSSTSDALTVVNKSTFDIDVALSAEVTGADGITLTDDKTFADDTSASVYLALIDGTNEAAITADGATIKTQVAAAPEGAYQYTWTQEDGYKYELVSGNDIDIEFADYSFQLTGASNSNGDWSDLADAAPEVTVTWDIKEHKDNAAPSITATTATFSKASGATISVDLGGGDLGATGIASVAIIASGKTYAFAAGTYTLTGSTLKFEKTASLASLAAGSTRTVRVTFDDAASTYFDLTVTVAD